jgi:hypothetical protein
MRDAIAWIFSNVDWIKMVQRGSNVMFCEIIGHFFFRFHKAGYYLNGSTVNTRLHRGDYQIHADPSFRRMSDHFHLPEILTFWFQFSTWSTKVSLLLTCFFISWRWCLLCTYYLGSCTIHIADHSGRAVWGMNCLRSLESWDRGFEYHSRHGCLCLFCVCVR